jgi:hypothetical protein
VRCLEYWFVGSLAVVRSRVARLCGIFVLSFVAFIVGYTPVRDGWVMGGSILHSAGVCLALSFLSVPVPAVLSLVRIV